MFRTRSPMVRKAEKTTSFITVLWRYILFSSFFWIIFSIICFIIAYNPEYGEKSRLFFFSSWQISLSFTFVLLGILFFSGLLGAIVSIPAIILKIIMKIQVEKRSRKGQKPVILIYSSTYFPILFCIISHLAALLVSTSAAPQYMRNWFRSSSKIYEMQQKIHKELFEIKSSEIYSKWKTAAKDLNPNAKFVFLMPQKLLMYKDSFSETKSILSNENTWLLYSSKKELITASILDEVYFADERLFIPAPIQFHNENYIDKYLKKNFKTKNFIGINGKNLTNFNNIFQKDSMNEYLNASWTNIFLNRIALSQPHFLIFYKIGFITPIFPAWKWDNLTNINSHLLLSYAKKITNIDKNKENFLLFLTEMEDINENGFFHSIEWPQNITKEEFERNLKSIDIYLSKAIQALKDSGHENIMVMPYSQKENMLEFGKGYSNSDFQNLLMYPEIINQQFIKKSSIYSCNPIALDYNLNSTKNFTHKANYFLLDTINSKHDNYPNIKKDYLLAIRNQIKYGVICQSPKKATYLTLKKENIFNNNLYFQKNSFKNINYQIFSPYEKKPKKIENDATSQTKSLKSEVNYNEFFKQFDVFKINPDPSMPYLTLTDSEREQFIKVYGNEVKNKFYSYINFSIK